MNRGFPIASENVLEIAKSHKNMCNLVVSAVHVMLMNH